jgi:phosphate transport system permease protein
MAVSPKPSSDRAIPARFQVALGTLWFDRFMTRFIKVGGILVIAAVAGIFVFILSQVIPLFRGAEVKPVRTFDAPKSDAGERTIAIGLDDWSELPVLVGEKGTLTFVDTRHGTPPKRFTPALPGEGEVSAVNYRQQSQKVIVGTTEGQFGLVTLNYSMTHADGHQQVVVDVKTGDFFQVGPAGGRIVSIGYGDGGEMKLAAAITEAGGRRQIHATTLSQKRSLLGKGKIAVGEQFDLTSEIRGVPEQILVKGSGDGVLVANSEGEIFYFYLANEGLGLRQTFQPFRGRSSSHIATMDFVLGDVSLVLSNDTGENVAYSLFVPSGGQDRLWGLTKTFPNLSQTANAYAASLRNKSFLVASGKTVSLRHATTESVRWEKTLPFEVVDVAIAGKHDRMLFLDSMGKLHLFALNDPHPEASWNALFGKVWYEGANEPKYEWQSTGSTDDFEPKLSLVPLIVGTLKGTFYALLFALPIALLAAVYTSAFLDPKFKRIVKPVMEIMASLPSVVLGFLAALWLAPVFKTSVPSLLAMIILVPVAAGLFGWLWAGRPYTIRRRIRYGHEVFFFAPLFLAVAWLAWQLGPWLERMLFVYTDPSTGARIADFRLWWPQVTGADFQQRNSLVVGFIMGFAVIPIIFTIAEDALSNVPQSLTSASLALGASRWQTALWVILPTASAGIFSAVMIGLGRAVGETMIVVMATGNTPIMDLNIFSGMRTLSANIAVELPEASHHGTLYRTLFLGAMILFVITFVVNTIAEVLRQHLREKFKTV